MRRAATKERQDTMGMERETLYDVLYALAARNGRDAVLFGTSASSAREAFARGLCGDTFPELWFEVPLKGDPWFDVHMLFARKDMRGDEAFVRLDDTYARVLSWFTTSRHTRQLALSFDSSTGDTGHPAVQLLLNVSSMTAPQGFLVAAGRADLVDAYHSFVTSIPRDWYPCYSGVFPSRPSTDWVRVECIVSEANQQAYANDSESLREHLGRVGMDDVDETLLMHTQELAQSPFPLELQFDVGQDGRALPRISASVRFQPQDWMVPSKRKDIERLFSRAEEWGLCDGRWRQLEQTVFAKRMARGEEAINLWCFPAFLKIRWRDGQGLDAKAYLMAGSS